MNVTRVCQLLTLALALQFAVAQPGHAQVSHDEIRERYAALLGAHAPSVLIAARAVIPAAALETVGGIPDWWDAFSREALMRLDSKRETQGWRDIETVLAAMPLGLASDHLDRMTRWISSYDGIREAGRFLYEFMDSAIAQTPETRHCFPRGDEFIARAGAEAGASLASGERGCVRWCVATYLSGLSPAEEARFIEELKKRAATLKGE